MSIKASHKQGIMKERSSPFFFPSAWLVLPINKVHINKFNSDKFNHPRTTLIKSLTRPIRKSWGREVKHSWHRGCHALTLPEHFQYKITPSHCTPTRLILLPPYTPHPPSASLFLMFPYPYLSILEKDLDYFSIIMCRRHKDLVKFVPRAMLKRNSQGTD